MTEWNALPEPLQLHLATQALHHASHTVAQHAELLAAEMEGGSLTDQGGPDALRLLAALVRAIIVPDHGMSGYGVCGHA